MDFIRHLFATDFMPHGFCLRWDPGVLWLHVISDALIALSYFVIPAALIRFGRKRKDFGFHWILIAFGVFILACGTMHVLNIVTLWVPVYRLDALISSITAIASVVTCVMLIRVLPVLLRMPSPADLQAEIARRSEAEQQLRELNVQMEDRVRQRTTQLERYVQAMEHVAFISSHDLREPLHTMHTFTEVLSRRCRTKLDDEDKKVMAFIVGGAQRMQRLLDDLLEYTRVVKASNEENLAVPTSLEDAARGAMTMIEDFIHECGAEIRIQPDLPFVYAQFAPLRQVFQNLLSNAIKYRLPCNPVQIDIKAAVRGSLCMVTVQDNGIGLDMRYAATIFEPFKRLHGPDIPGSGVGLALCKSVMQSFGGKIWVESSGPGRGSQFHFALPLEQVQLHSALESFADSYGPVHAANSIVLSR